MENLLLNRNGLFYRVCSIILCIIFLCSCTSKEPYQQCKTMEKALKSSDVVNCYITKLGEYKNLNYDAVDAMPVSDSDIDNYINDIAIENAEYELITKRATVENNDTINITFEGYIDDKLVNSVQSDLFTLGENCYSKDFENKLIGLEKNKENIFYLDVPKNEKKYAGKKEKFIVTINSIQKRIPLNTSQIISRMYFDKGVETEKQLKEYIRKELETQNKEISYKENCGRIMDLIIYNSDFELSSETVETFSLGVVDNYCLQAEFYGLTLEEYYLKHLNKSEKNFYSMCCEEGKRSIKEYLVIGAIAQIEEKDVENDDVNKLIENVYDFLMKNN